MHGLTACRQWAEKLLQGTAALRGGSGHWNSINASRHCLGQWVVGLGMGDETPTRRCLNAWGQWAVEPVQRIALLPGGSGRWDSCNALPH